MITSTAEQTTSLKNLGEGAATELFDLALDEVLEDLENPNKAGGPREIILKVKIKPTSTNGIYETEITCDPKLAKQVPYTTGLFVGKNERGKIEAREIVQQSLFDNPATGGKVVPMKDKGGSK